MIRWGIDLGGTKIEGVVLDDQKAQPILARKRIATESDKGYNHVLNQIQQLVELLESETNLSPSKIGIGTPGSIDPPTGLLKNSNSQNLNGKPFLQDIEDLLGVSVVVANDANCFALAEHHMGIVADVVPDAQVTFGVIMGTGVGGGLVINGQVINGANGIGGEWEHNHLDDSGGPCYCGKVGCMETVISGPALMRHYHALSRRELALQDIIAFRKKDKHAQETYDRLITMFGKAISTIINMIDPDVIVIGGGVGNIDELYTEGVESIKQYVFNPRCDTPILKPKLGDSAGVFGAAYLD